MYKQSLEDPSTFWGNIASEFHWERKWDTSRPICRYNFDIRKGPIFTEVHNQKTPQILTLFAVGLIPHQDKNCFCCSGSRGDIRIFATMRLTGMSKRGGGTRSPFCGKEMRSARRCGSRTVMSWPRHASSRITSASGA